MTRWDESLGLSYPSGKEIDRLAHLGEDTYHFPRAMIHEDNFDFSFSGLKSAFINFVHNAQQQRGETLDEANLAASFQASVVEGLVTKTIRACKTYPVNQFDCCRWRCCKPRPASGTR